MASESDDAGECKYLRDQPFAEECEEALRAAASDIEGGVTESEYEQWAAAQSDNLPSVGQIVAEFERSLYEVCDDLDIPHNAAFRTGVHSDDEIFSAIKQAADRVGQPLTTGKYENWREDTSQSHPTVHTISTRIGWSSACEQVGVTCGYKTPRHTDEDILSAIKRAAADQGEPLTAKKYADWREGSNQLEPSVQTMLRREGSWNMACERADVAHGRREFSIKEIEMSVQLAAEICGEPLSITEYKAWQGNADNHHPSSGAIRSRVRWSDICEQVGVENVGSGRGQPTYSQEDIIIAIKQAASDCGESLTAKKYASWRENTNEKYPTCRTIVDRIGWNEACKQAEINTPSPTDSDDTS